MERKKIIFYVNKIRQFSNIEHTRTISLSIQASYDTQKWNIATYTLNTANWFAVGCAILSSTSIVSLTKYFRKISNKERNEHEQIK